MVSVIVRHGHTIDDAGFIQYDETPSTIEEAERIAGRRLDRRRNYAIIPSQELPGAVGPVCATASWTQPCSGCEGFRCEECGYTGKRRHSMWVPIDVLDGAEEL